jgi:hypothetical protein
MIDNGSSDNCSDISASLNPKQFNCDQLGAQSIEVTLKDAAGNNPLKWLQSISLMQRLCLEQLSFSRLPCQQLQWLD